MSCPSPSRLCCLLPPLDGVVRAQMVTPSGVVFEGLVFFWTPLVVVDKLVCSTRKKSWTYLHHQRHYPIYTKLCSRQHPLLKSEMTNVHFLFWNLKKVFTGRDDEPLVVFVVEDGYKRVNTIRVWSLPMGVRKEGLFHYCGANAFDGILCIDFGFLRKDLVL